MAQAERDIQVENLRRMVQDFDFYARHCLRILPKDGGAPVPFVMNRAQRYIHERIEEQLAKTGRVRALLLKGRQQGGSTYIQGRFRWKIKHRKGRKAYVVAHEQAATNNLFKMAKQFHENEPADVKPVLGASNANELWFSKLNSRYEVATAGTKEIGRSGTAQYLHASEYAFWPNAESHWAGIGQVVPPLDDTEVIVETTANGINNDFARRWKRAEAGIGDFIAIFVPWFWQEEYVREVPEGWERTDEEEELVELYQLTDEQLSFRRNKIEDDFKGDTSRFQQEYPCCAAEAFVATNRNLLIPIAQAMRAQLRAPIRSGALVAGLDPARFGDDRTALVVRQGRAVVSYKTYDKHDTMEVAGVAARLLEKNPNIQMLFIDVIGVGAGVVDRLNELGFGEDGQGRVMGVNFSHKASDEDAYVNKRSECWGEMAEWSKNGTIPEGDEWLADVTSTAFSYDSRSRVKLEKKEDVKKESGKSPDLADALALTFAEPVIQAPSRGPTINARKVLDEQTGY